MIRNNFDLAVVIILLCILFFVLIPRALEEWGWTFKRILEEWGWTFKRALEEWGGTFKRILEECGWTFKRALEEWGWTFKRALEEWGWTFKRHESQQKHYCVQIVNLPPNTTTSLLKDWFKGPTFLGAEVVADILSGECSGMGIVYFEDKNTAEAAIEDLSSDLGLSGTLVEVDKPWSGFHFLTEKQYIGRCKVDCYGVGALDFGQFCVRCGLPGHYASKCMLNLECQDLTN